MVLAADARSSRSLTMVVGAVLAVVQTDMKRMLAYSSVAHPASMLTGVLGVQQASELSDGQVTSSLQAVCST